MVRASRPFAFRRCRYYGNMEHGWTDPSSDVYSYLEGEAAHQDMFGTYRLVFPR